MEADSEAVAALNLWLSVEMPLVTAVQATAPGSRRRTSFWHIILKVSDES